MKSLMIAAAAILLAGLILVISLSGDPMGTRNDTMKDCPVTQSLASITPGWELPTLDNEDGSSASSDDQPGRVRKVRVARVEKAETFREMRFSGVTRAVRHAKLAFTISERIKTRPVEVGDEVKKGDELASLDDRRFANAVAVDRASLQEIEARLDQLARDRKRYEELVAARATAEVDLEKILEKEKCLLASKSMAEAKLSESERLLDETVLKAPFSGVVTEALLEPGEIAAPGVPIVVLSGDRDLEIEVEVSESLILGLSKGQKVSVDLPLASKRGVTGVIRYLGRTAMGAGRLFPVLIALDADPEIAPGMTAEVVFKIPVEGVLCVPVSALVDPGGHNPTLFRVSHGSVERVSVKVGQVVGEKITVKGPLHEDEVVVAGGHLALLDGDRVEVVPDETR